MRFHCTPIALTILVTVACRDTPPRSQSSASRLSADTITRGPVSNPEGDSSSVDRILARFIDPGATPGEVKTRYGPPDSVVTLARDSVGSRQRVFYRDFTSDFWIGRDGRSLVSNVVATTDALLRQTGIHIGMSVDQVKIQLGQPFADRDGSLWYSGYVCEACSMLVFHIEGGFVRAVEVSYYED